jgi:hypothetical protein
METKEEIKVILNSKELGKYFGPEKSPREMKEQILKILDEWKDRHPELNAIPEEHKSGVDIGRDLLKRSHVLVVFLRKG